MTQRRTGEGVEVAARGAQRVNRASCDTSTVFAVLFFSFVLLIHFRVVFSFVLCEVFDAFVLFEVGFLLAVLCGIFIVFECVDF